MKSGDLFLGYKIVDTNVTEFTDNLFADLKAGRVGLVVDCLNPHSVCVAAHDQEFHRALMESDYLVPDGIGVVYGARLLGVPICERITGSDVFNMLSVRLERDDASEWRVLFVGSTRTVLNKIERRMRLDFPRLNVVGTISPPFADHFTEQDAADIALQINAAQPNIVWVGITAPKQEKLIQKLKPIVNCQFLGGIGAVFDFYAETKSRAPKIVQRLGLEWMHRLVSEPKRVWRRTFITAPQFVALIMRAYLHKCVSPSELPPRKG